MSAAPHFGFEVEDRLDWVDLSEALADGHGLPRAEIADSFLYRGADTILSRCAWIDGLGALVKTATVFPGNPAQGLPGINGAVTLLSDADGTVAATLDFHLVTKWKTAADSLLAARRLARPDSGTLLICGAGAVARALVAAYRAGFPGIEVEIWNRTVAKAETMADELDCGVAANLPEAVARADIICGATMATHPWLDGAWLRPGQHIDLIGAYRPDMREAQDSVLRRSRIFMDSRDTVIGHIGELKLPLEAGVIQTADIVADYYSLTDFTRSADDITFFKNGGGAHLDLMTARFVLDQAVSI